MIIELTYIIFCLLLAYANKRRISYDLVIYHAINGICHAVFLAAAFLLTKSWFPVVILPLIGRLFFDASLNIFRGLPVDYVAKNPKSLIDKLEKSIFGNDGILPKLIYLIIIIALNILHYVS